jgi:hypothetical protein
MYGATMAVNRPSASASNTSAHAERRMPRSPRTTICVSSRALTITGRRAADVSDGIVDLALGQGFLIFGQLADLVADLLGEDAQAKPRGQHAL